MSLVVCANAERDNINDNLDGGLNNAWSFRNTLSSTYKIPANSQVALQSCKINVDGRVVITGDNANFYQYFGQKLDLDGETSPQLEDTTSYPVFASLLKTDSEKNQVLELSKEEVANRLKDALNDSMFHPNVKNMIDVEILKNASGLDFNGYKISFDESDRSNEHKPTSFEDFVGLGQPKNGTGLWTFSSDILTRNASADDTDIVGVISKSHPISTYANSSLTVNISSANANANSSGVEWHVGLSRFINFTNDETNQFTPPYYDFTVEDNLDVLQDVFCDFAIARNHNDELVCYQSSYDSLTGSITKTEVQYWTNASSDFAGAGRTNISGTNYTQARISITGEQVKAELYNATTTDFDVITFYKSGQPKDSFFKPVNQACWCLHPVLAIGREGTNTTCSLEIHGFNGKFIANYDPETLYRGGWYESMELLGAPVMDCLDVESRVFNDMSDSTAYTQIGVNASDGIDYDPVLILGQNEIYTPSENANAKDLLGFEKSVIDTPFSTTGNLKVFHSTTIPTTSNLLSMFVRLDNFGQSVVNALTGNESKIIAHLTSVETNVGRRTYEPSSLIYIDLNNPAELNISDFNLSFCYANEQYARILQGQSIICLYIRPKPKMLM